MKKALFAITKGDSIGGASIHVLNLATYCKSIGITPIIVFGQRGRFSELLQESGIKTISLNTLSNTLSPIHDIASIFRLIRVIEKINPCLVSLHSGKAGLLGRIACFLLGRHAIFTIHGWSYTGWETHPRRIAYMLLENIASAIFSRSISHIMVSRYDFRIAPIITRLFSRSIVIHNGTNHPEIRKDLNKKKAPGLRLITVCRIDEQKDVESLIKAMQYTKNASLLIVGGGSLLDKCKSLTARLGLTSKITFTGEVDPSAVGYYLSQSDCFILCSYWEGFPRSTVEAMSLGLPVLLSNTGGSCEVFDYGLKTGLTWGKTNNPLEIAKCINYYVENPHEAIIHGENGQKVWREFLTVESMCISHHDYWSELGFIPARSTDL